MRKLLSTVSIFFASVGAGESPAPQSPPPACTDAAYRQFDFWVGDWNVTQNGKAAGTNRIEKILGGCALLERWEGISGSRGNSLNYYDSARGVWHQTWVDNQGGPLELEGGFRDGKMVLLGDTKDPASGAGVINRLAWTPLADGRVRQLWETSTDAGRSWQTAFDGWYSRR